MSARVDVDCVVGSGKPMSARKVWESFSDTKPKHVARICDTAGCLNPRHYEPADRLCRAGKHPLNPSNTRDGDFRCRTCWEQRVCKRCGRQISGDNVLYDYQDRVRGCFACHVRGVARRAAQAVYKATGVMCGHDLTPDDAVVYTGSTRHRGWRCRLCYEQRTCAKGHLLAETGRLEEMVAKSGKLVIREVCTTCHADRWRYCGKGTHLMSETTTPGSCSQCQHDRRTTEVYRAKSRKAARERRSQRTMQQKLIESRYRRAKYRQAKEAS